MHSHLTIYNYIHTITCLPVLFIDNSLARKLSSVPLDFDASLTHYRAQLEKSGYNARALKHSRRLLVLYLGGQQSGKYHQILYNVYVIHRVFCVVASRRGNRLHLL